MASTISCASCSDVLSPSIQRMLRLAYLIAMSGGWTLLILPVPAPHRLEQLGPIVSHVVLEHDLDVLDIRNASGWIPLHHHQVCVLPDGNRADLTLVAEKD